MNYPSPDKNAKIKVLLIEDDSEFAHSMGVRLSKNKDHSMDVETAHTLEVGLHYLLSKSYDLILLDLTLPDSYGFETYSRVQKYSSDIPIVILTGWDNDAAAVEAVRHGAEDYLVKGEVQGKMMVRILHHAVERHRSKKELSRLSMELQESNKFLEQMALLDPLTNIPNRRGLQSVLFDRLKQCETRGVPLFALFLDVDNFKYVNDTFGYAIGDILIKEVARVLQRTARTTDYLARMGGDEFIVLLSANSLRSCVDIAEKIRASISDVNVLTFGNKQIKTSASGGVVCLPYDTSSIDELSTLAHPMLRQAKITGKNRLAYDSGACERCNREENIKMRPFICDLRDSRKFEAVTQPIVRFSDREIVAYEFLSRRKGNKLTMPKDFFKVALENDVLTMIDRYCFTACIKASRQIPNDVRRHINLFPSTLLDIPVSKLVDSLHSEGNGKQSFCIEISEQQILGDPAYLMNSISVLKKAGVQIAVDDVGFGYSCLESLIDFEPDIIKLDQRYVKGVASDAKRMRSLEMLVRIAKDIDAEIIAEGIESKDDLRVVVDLGVEFGQGYFFGKPSKLSTLQK